MTSSDVTVYKVTTRTLWERGRQEGHLPYSPIDDKDGFMHLSTGGQLAETLRLHFAGQADLVLCAVPAATLAADLKWEPSRGGALFPHLYGALPLAAISAHYDIAVADDGSVDLPAGLE